LPVSTKFEKNLPSFSTEDAPRLVDFDIVTGVSDELASVTFGVQGAHECWTVRTEASICSEEKADMYQ
jgi:hypothetical protein